MGVRAEDETEGNYPAELRCSHCKSTFWTDETMGNDCPECGFQSYEPA